MASPKVSRILGSKTSLGAEQIAGMTDGEGWALIYGAATPNAKPAEVCFTGFTSDEKETLGASAADAHLRVVTGVTKHLTYLCMGDAPGEVKIRQAQERGATCLSKEQFLLMLETGEVPERASSVD